MEDGLHMNRNRRQAYREDDLETNATQIHLACIALIDIWLKLGAGNIAETNANNTECFSLADEAFDICVKFCSGEDYFYAR